MFLAELFMLTWVVLVCMVTCDQNMREICHHTSRQKHTDRKGLSYKEYIQKKMSFEQVKFSRQSSFCDFTNNTDVKLTFHSAQIINHFYAVMNYYNAVRQFEN